MPLLKLEYDFLTWTSFPSSLKALNTYPERRGWWTIVPRNVRVEGGKNITVKVKAKLKNVAAPDSYITIYGYDMAGKQVFPPPFFTVRFGYGTFNWREHESSMVVPAETAWIGAMLVSGPGSEERPAETWIDDLKVYQDDKFIYVNDFSNWNPYIGAGALGIASGIGAHQLTKNVPIAVGAGVVGALVGAAIGYFIPPIV